MKEHLYSSYPVKFQHFRCYISWGNVSWKLNNLQTFVRLEGMKVHLYSSNPVKFKHFRCYISWENVSWKLKSLQTFVRLEGMKEHLYSSNPASLQTFVWLGVWKNTFSLVTLPSFSISGVNQLRKCKVKIEKFTDVLWLGVCVCKFFNFQLTFSQLI